MLKLILSVLLFGSVFSYLQDITPDFPTSETPASTTEAYGTETATSEPLSCFCKTCEIDTKFISTHTQTEFCQSDAVILGRITHKTGHDSPAGIWKPEQHPYQRKLDEHWEYSVRVLQVYHNEAAVKVSLGDKITIRAKKSHLCPECEMKVEDFDNTDYDQLFLATKQKYFFFIPTLSDEHGDKTEGVLNECSRVWKYSKLDSEDGEALVPPIVRIKRYLLHSTTCDKCVVTGCLQNKCVPVGEEESCPERDSIYFHSLWINNSCKPLMDYGICHFNTKQGKCLWTSVTEDRVKSRKPIRECFINAVV